MFFYWVLYKWRVFKHRFCALCATIILYNKLFTNKVWLIDWWITSTLQCPHKHQELSLYWRIFHEAVHKAVHQVTAKWNQCLAVCLPFTLIPFSLVACKCHGSSADPHKSSADTSLKPCLRITNILCFSLGHLAVKSVGDVWCTSSVIR